ncbi:MAG: SMP-30/gluconolactonase/LRE family protein [Pirellulaceae bacterium]|nr:SMP-30/gluconolactonase/LRE family protein [Pirellulaceae bacterium]
MWLCVLAVPVSGQDADIVVGGAKLQTLATEFKFTEGPATDSEGNVYFTDQPNDRIMKWSVDGDLSTFLTPCGRSNGLYFDLDGSLLACADEKNELWDIQLDGSHKVLVDQFNGKLLNGPNDLWLRPDGGIYFTDPLYKRPYWNRGPIEQDGHCVYFLNKDRTGVTRVADSLEKPNGIVGTPDGKTLYVADIGAGKTYRFVIQGDGSLSDKTLFCELGSDGMTIDDQGNVYLTGKGVTVFNSAGEKIHHIDVPQGWTANVCFGGKQRKTLFITASKGLYAMEMNVRGTN